MADEKLNTGPGEEKFPEAPAPVTVDEPQAPAPEQTAAPTPQQEGPAQPEPGDVVVSFDKINELMNEKRQTARAENALRSPELGNQHALQSETVMTEIAGQVRAEPVIRKKNSCKYRQISRCPPGRFKNANHRD